MPFDIEQWISSLTEQNIEVPDELKQGYMRQSDYDRKMNKLKEEHAQRMAIEDEFHSELMSAKEKLELVQQLEAQYGPAETWSETLTEQVAEAHPQLSQPSKGQEPRMDDINSILEQKIKELDQKYSQQLEAIGTGSAIMIDFMSDKPFEFKDKYGKKFPKEEFNKFFQQSGTRDPYLAYQVFEQQFAEEKQKADYEAAIKEAEQKGYQSAMSKYGNVESPTAASEGMFFKAGALKSTVDPATGQPTEKAPAEPSYEERKAAVGSAYVKAMDSYTRTGNTSKAESE